MKPCLFVLLVCFASMSGYASWKIDEPFEDVYPAPGWSEIYLTAPGSAADYTQLSDDMAFSGDSSLRFGSDDTPDAQCWVFTPQVTIEAGDELNYWVNGSNTSYAIEQFEIWKCSTPSPAGATIMLFDGWSSVGWEQRSLALDVFAGENIYLGIKYKSDNREFLYIDDFKVGTDGSLLNESFEAAWNSSSPWGPAGWSESTVATGLEAGDSAWGQDDYSGAISGDYIAYIYERYDASDSWLISPSIDLSANNRTDYLEYYLRLRYLGTGDFFNVMISTDDGASWDILKQYSSNDGVSSDLVRQEVDLSAYNDQTNVKIAFYADYNQGYRVRAYLDAVKIDEHGQPGMASIDEPDNGDVDVDVFTSLSWMSATFATEYDVYVGTDESAVEAATNASDEFVGSVTATSYQPAEYLSGSTTFYWRVDARNNYGVYTGNVWSFTTAADPNCGGGGTATACGGYYYSNTIAANPQFTTDYTWINTTGAVDLYGELSSGSGYAGGAEGYNIGFSFPFFDGVYSRCWLGADGWISFSNPAAWTSSQCDTNQQLPDAAPANNLIALFWDDLNPFTPQPGSHLYMDAVDGNMVITYEHFYSYMTMSPEKWFTAQAILSPDGSIKLQYKEKDAAMPLDDCTVGIEDANGAFGILYRYNGSGGPLFSASRTGEYAIEFKREDSMLPVVLSDFSAIAVENEYSQINWTTQSESGLVGYLVSRSESITTQPEMISHLIAATNLSQTQHYQFEDHQVEAGTSYYYWLDAVHMDGTSSCWGPVEVTIEEVTTPALPEITLLHGNFPNPFNPVTSISFIVKENETADLTIYNVRGQQVEKRTFEAGEHSFAWDATEFGSGVYFYSLKSASYSKTSKMIMLK